MALKDKANYPVYWLHEKYDDVIINGEQKNKLPPLEILNWLFCFDSENGKLFRIREPSGKLCNPEREIIKVRNGYLNVAITDSVGKQKTFQVHHICYYMHYGIEPLQIVDHIDQDRLNNRPDNFQLVSATVNQRNRGINSNNTSGITGIYWHKQYKKWQAYIKINSKMKHIGSFNSLEEASTARENWIATFNFQNPLESFSERHGSI
jgi:hypothetical protein